MKMMKNIDIDLNWPFSQRCLPRRREGVSVNLYMPIEFIVQDWADT